MLYAPLARLPAGHVARRWLPTVVTGTFAQPDIVAPLAVNVTVPPLTGGLLTIVAVSGMARPSGDGLRALVTVVAVGAAAAPFTTCDSVVLTDARSRRCRRSSRRSRGYLRERAVVQAAVRVLPEPARADGAAPADPDAIARERHRPGRRRSADRGRERHAVARRRPGCAGGDRVVVGGGSCCAETTCDKGALVDAPLAELPA